MDIKVWEKNYLVVVGAGEISTRGLRVFSRTSLCRFLEKHLNPRIDISPAPTTTRY